MQRWNRHQSTSLAESQKALEAHGCKPWLTNLSIVPHTLGILTANITYCIILLKCVRSVVTRDVPRKLTHTARLAQEEKVRKCDEKKTIWNSLRTCTMNCKDWQMQWTSPTTRILLVSPVPQQITIPSNRRLLYSSTLYHRTFLTGAICSTIFTRLKTILFSYLWDTSLTSSDCWYSDWLSTSYFISRRFGSSLGPSAVHQYSVCTIAIL